LAFLSRRKTIFSRWERIYGFKMPPAQRASSSAGRSAGNSAVTPGAGRAFAAIPELDGDTIDVVVRHAMANVVAEPSSRAGGWPPFLGAALALRSTSRAFSDSVRRSNVVKNAIRRRLWACLGATEAMRLLLTLPHDLRAIARTHPLIISTLGGFVPNTRRFAVFAFNNKYWDLLGWALAHNHAAIRLYAKHRLKRVKIPRGAADCRLRH
jgi:hypothetical protein